MDLSARATFTLPPNLENLLKGSVNELLLRTGKFVPSEDTFDLQLLLEEMKHSIELLESDRTNYPQPSFDGVAATESSSSSAASTAPASNANASTLSAPSQSVASGLAGPSTSSSSVSTLSAADRVLVKLPPPDDPVIDISEDSLDESSDRPVGGVGGPGPDGAGAPIAIGSGGASRVKVESPYVGAGARAPTARPETSVASQKQTRTSRQQPPPIVSSISVSTAVSVSAASKCPLSPRTIMQQQRAQQPTGLLEPPARLSTSIRSDSQAESIASQRPLVIAGTQETARGDSQPDENGSPPPYPDVIPIGILCTCVLHNFIQLLLTQYSL